ncbi:hypothetical protein BJV82DRAFT_624661 [Fennellomyces sp. T-0311]|nr:hypothetical protein BJV82DRAFT_624661 [Fennellomyces sp. T-0311]
MSAFKIRTKKCHSVPAIRCLRTPGSTAFAISVTASTEKSKFLVGTVGVKNNVVCLLEFDEDKSEINPTLFDHPNEIWDIESCPSDESLFFTCHSPD